MTKDANFIHLPLCIIITETEVGAAVLVIKAEETKQQISRLNNEVWRVYFSSILNCMDK